MIMIIIIIHVDRQSFNYMVEQETKQTLPLFKSVKLEQ